MRAKLDASPRRTAILGVFIAVALLLLNLTWLHFDPVYLWARVLVSLLLICGFVGTAASMRGLREAS